MNLNELFNTSINVKTDYEGSKSAAYSFEIENKRYEVGFSNVSTIRIVDADSVWEVGFELVDEKSRNGGKFEITGTGDAFKVFSVVKQCVERFLSKYTTVDKLYFVADNDEPSRVRLYKRFIETFKVPGWTASSIERQHDTKFSIERIEK